MDGPRDYQNLSKASQKEKDKCYMITTYVWNLK